MTFYKTSLNIPCYFNFSVGNLYDFNKCVNNTIWSDGL